MDTPGCALCAWYALPLGDERIGTREKKQLRGKFAPIGSEAHRAWGQALKDDEAERQAGSEHCPSHNSQARAERDAKIRMEMRRHSSGQREMPGAAEARDDARRIEERRFTAQERDAEDAFYRDMQREHDKYVEQIHAAVRR